MASLISQPCEGCYTPEAELCPIGNVTRWRDEVWDEYDDGHVATEDEAITMCEACYDEVDGSYTDFLEAVYGVVKENRELTIPEMNQFHQEVYDAKVKETNGASCGSKGV